MPKMSKVTCLSINCPERKSLCCGAYSDTDEDREDGSFICSKCGIPFAGGRCDQDKAPSEELLAELAQFWFESLEDQTLKAMITTLIQSQKKKIVEKLKNIKWKGVGKNVVEDATRFETLDEVVRSIEEDK